MFTRFSENIYFFVLGLSINLTKFGKENAYEKNILQNCMNFINAYIYICIYSKKILKGSKHL